MKHEENNKGMSRNPTSLLIVFIQFLTLIFLFLTGPVIPSTILSWIVEIGGFILGFWSIWSMRISNFQITADVAPGSVLVTNGPYSFVRHPMYGAVMLVASGLLINDFSLVRLLAVAVLYATFILRSEIEESMLVKYFKKDYEDYQKKTARFLPFIY